MTVADKLNKSAFENSKLNHDTIRGWLWNLLQFLNVVSDTNSASKWDKPFQTYQ